MFATVLGVRCGLRCGRLIVNGDKSLVAYDSDVPDTVWNFVKYFGIFVSICTTFFT